MFLDRFYPPDEPTDRELRINALYYKRLDILEEVKQLRRTLEDLENRRDVWEEIERLEEEAFRIEQLLNDMGCSP